MRRAKQALRLSGFLALMLAFGCSPSHPLARSTRSTQSVHPEIGGISLSPGEDPFAHGQSMSLTEAEGLVPFHVYRPDDALAFDANLSAVWVEQSGKAEGIDVFQVALQYATGIRILLGTPTPNATADPKAFLESLGEGLEGASVQTVLGVPALVLPDSDVVPGSVVMILDKVQVEVIGPFPIDEVTRVANSLT